MSRWLPTPAGRAILARKFLESKHFIEIFQKSLRFTPCFLEISFYNLGMKTAVSRMVKPAKGYRTLFVQIPEVVWDAVAAIAEEKGETLNNVVAAMLARQAGVSKKLLPAPKRPGRKPKKKGEGDS